MADELSPKKMSAYTDADSITDADKKAYYKANAKFTTVGKMSAGDTGFSNYNLTLGNIAEAVADGSTITASNGKLSAGAVSPDTVAKTATLSGTDASVTLDNGKYNVIAEISATATTLTIAIPAVTSPTLQECGFEFTLATGTALTSVSATMGGNALPIIKPSSFAAGNIYQGTSVNGRVTIVEFNAPAQAE